MTTIRTAIDATAVAAAVASTLAQSINDNKDGVLVLSHSTADGRRNEDSTMTRATWCAHRRVVGDAFETKADFNVGEVYVQLANGDTYLLTATKL